MSLNIWGIYKTFVDSQFKEEIYGKQEKDVGIFDNARQNTSSSGIPGDAWDEEKRWEADIGPVGTYGEEIDNLVDEVLQGNEETFKKFDQGKPRLNMLFDLPKAITKVIEGLMYGIKKYDRKNWRKVEELERYNDAALRHQMAYAGGEYYDPESGIPHLALAIDSLLFVLELEEEKTRDPYKGSPENVKDLEDTIYALSGAGKAVRDRRLGASERRIRTETCHRKDRRVHIKRRGFD